MTPGILQRGRLESHTNGHRRENNIQRLDHEVVDHCSECTRG